MKHLYIFLFIAMVMVIASQPALAQFGEDFSTSLRGEEDRMRLLKADSLYKVRDALANETQRELQQAKSDLKAAQARYDEAKREHKFASKAAKEAKKSYQMEQKAQKAEKKADKQAEKAESAALQ